MSVETLAPPIPTRATVALDPLSDDDRRFINAAAGLGLFANSQPAVYNVGSVLRDREAAIRAGDAGRRVATIRQREKTTREELAALKAAREKAEADHFAALGGDDEPAIAAARAAVLAADGKIRIVETEIESLRRIEVEARGALGTAFNRELPIVHADITIEAGKMRSEALAAIRDAMQNGLADQFAKLAYSTQILSIIGNDPHALRCIASDNNLSLPFGRPKPVGHVSLKGPEFDNLDSETLDGLRVNV